MVFFFGTASVSSSGLICSSASASSVSTSMSVSSVATDMFWKL